MKIRKATLEDFKQLYALASHIPELRVVPRHHFMSKDEFKNCITNRNGVLLVAQEKQQIIGLCYASLSNFERNWKKRWACLVYVAVHPKHRGQGIATKLYNECIRKLKKKEVSNVYGWVNKKSKAEIGFLKKHGFELGNEFVWNEKKI